MNVRDLIAKAEKRHVLERDEITVLLQGGDWDEELFAAADGVRRRYVGDAVHLRGLIEFSNICRRNCLYCGLRHDNRHLLRYRMDEDTIISLAIRAKEMGYRTVVLQSGEDEYFNVDRMTRIIRRLKALDFAVTLSIGEKSYAEYAAYREAGADRYLLRIETTDAALYARLDPGMDLAERINCLHNLKRLGYEVGTGSLIGLPGQSLASLADDILFFQALDADMIGTGPFIPNPDTPLGDAAGGSFELSRRMVALVRLLLPDANIPATTAMETIHPEGRILALKSGANVVMPNITEGEYRRLYALYPGKACADETPAHCRSGIEGKIAAIGRFVGKDYGFRRRI